MFMPEPDIMAIARSPAELRKHKIHSKKKQTIDYTKVQRSSGDGMEHADTTPDHKLYARHITLPSNLIDQTHIDHAPFITNDQHLLVDISTGIPDDQRQTKHQVGNHHLNDQKQKNKVVIPNSQKEFIPNEGQNRMGIDNSSNAITLTYSGESPEKDILNLKLKINTEEPLECIDLTQSHTQESKSLSEMANLIKELEERNAKLVEDKTKMCLQLGLQTQVNSDMKKLLVAAVTEDLENSLEALLMKNAQSGVEIKHWKTLSEEYAEESDKLAIECDVWRTKFMASRMMSDELSSWKTTLYTKYKETQSALQRILNERGELQKYLLTTKRLLYSLGHVVKCSAGSYESAEVLTESYGICQQSVLELASIISCLVQDLATQIEIAFEASLIPSLPVDQEEERLTVQPTPAERFALQVLSSDIELHTEEEQEESSVMKRMGKQYIGNSYKSRLMTNSFRVTYDCCDRCRGPVHVV